jgi:hypothetical protein
MRRSSRNGPFLIRCYRPMNGPFYYRCSQSRGKCRSRARKAGPRRCAGSADNGRTSSPQAGSPRATSGNTGTDGQLLCGTSRCIISPLSGPPDPSDKTAKYYQIGILSPDILSPDIAPGRDRVDQYPSCEGTSTRPQSSRFALTGFRSSRGPGWAGATTDAS